MEEVWTQQFNNLCAEGLSKCIKLLALLGAEILFCLLLLLVVVAVVF